MQPSAQSSFRIVPLCPKVPFSPFSQCVSPPLHLALGIYASSFRVYGFASSRNFMYMEPYNMCFFVCSFFHLAFLRFILVGDSVIWFLLLRLPLCRNPVPVDGHLSVQTKRCCLRSAPVAATSGLPQGELRMEKNTR